MKINKKTPDIITYFLLEAALQIMENIQRKKQQKN